MMNKRVYDVAFKKMSVELSDTKGRGRGTGYRSGADQHWKNQYKSVSTGTVSAAGLGDEQKEIRKLQKEPMEAQQERDTLKKAVSIFYRGDGGYSDL